MAMLRVVLAACLHEIGVLDPLEVLFEKEILEINP
jgi:hypothetical protein